MHRSSQLISSTNTRSRDLICISVQRYLAELLQRAPTLQLERAHIETVFAGVNELYEAHARMLKQLRAALLPPPATPPPPADATAAAADPSVLHTTPPPLPAAAATAGSGPSTASANNAANSAVSNGGGGSGTSALEEAIDNATLGDIFYANVRYRVDCAPQSKPSGKSCAHISVQFRCIICVVMY